MRTSLILNVFCRSSAGQPFGNSAFVAAVIRALQGKNAEVNNPEPPEASIHHLAFISFKVGLLLFN